MYPEYFPKTNECATNPIPLQDVQLRLASLPPPRGAPSTRLNLSQFPGAPVLVLRQLVSVRDLVAQSLDIVDVSTWTGDPLNAGFIFSQLHLLLETISEARQMLKGENDETRGKWWDTSATENVCSISLTQVLQYFADILHRCLTLRFRRTFHSISLSQTPP